MKLIFKIGKVFLASQVLLGVAYASRNGVDLGRAHRIARRSIFGESVDVTQWLIR